MSKFSDFMKEVEAESDPSDIKALSDYYKEEVQFYQLLKDLGKITYEYEGSEDTVVGFYIEREGHLYEWNGKTFQVADYLKGQLETIMEGKE